jgi:hypothetical protein
MSPCPNFWRSILILSSHRSLGLQSGLLMSYFPSKTLYAPLISYVLHAPCISFFSYGSHNKQRFCVPLNINDKIRNIFYT